MNEGYRVPQVGRDSLPPRDVWLHNPRLCDRIETPLQPATGIVDLDALVTAVKSTIDPEFDWTSTFNDVHHLQWHSAQYSTPLGRAFREQAQRKTYVPRLFHNWAHVITEVPPVPSEEAMRHSIAAQQSVFNMARTAGLATRLERMIAIPPSKLRARQQQEFEKYMVYFENARLVPEEFSLLAVGEVEARTPDDLPACSRKLGSLALDRIPWRVRALTPASVFT